MIGCLHKLVITACYELVNYHNSQSRNELGKIVNIVNECVPGGKYYAISYLIRMVSGSYLHRKRY